MKKNKPIIALAVVIILFFVFAIYQFQNLFEQSVYLRTLAINEIESQKP